MAGLSYRSRFNFIERKFVLHMIANLYRQPPRVFVNNSSFYSLGLIPKVFLSIDVPTNDRLHAHSGLHLMQKGQEDGYFKRKRVWQNRALGTSIFVRNNNIFYDNLDGTGIHRFLLERFLR